MRHDNIGLWNEKSLAYTVSNYNGTQYYQNLPDDVRFTHSIAKILATQHADDEQLLSSKPAIFILGSVPTTKNIEFKRHPTFSQGNVNVAGHIWFGSTAFNSSLGTQIPSNADIASIFEFVCNDLDSGKLPGIFFNGHASNNTFRYYPEGFDAPDKCLDIPFGQCHIDELSLKNALDRIHDRALCTPTSAMAASKLWSKSPKCWPAKNPEAEIQSIIEIGLGQSLGNARVKREITGQLGRFDLAIVEQSPSDPSTHINHAVLELKVVKSFTSSGTKVTDSTNHFAIAKGIKQAYAYQDEHKFRFSALCCYDMQKPPSLHKIPETKCKLARDLGVRLWSWPLYSTTEAAREALIEQRIAK